MALDERVRAASSYGGSNESEVHGTYYWDGSGGNQFIKPRLQIKAIG